MWDEAMFYYMAAVDDDDAPDGAWWAMLEDAARFWAEDNGKQVDTHEAVHAYLRWNKDYEIVEDTGK